MVQESNGFCSCTDEIVRAHCYTVYPDCVVLLHHLSDDHLRPDVICMEAQNLVASSIDQPCIVTYGKDRESKLTLPGNEGCLKLSGKQFVGGRDFAIVDPCLGVRHPRLGQFYSFSPVKRSYAIMYRLLVSSTSSDGRSGGRGVGRPSRLASSRVFLYPTLPSQSRITCLS